MGNITTVSSLLEWATSTRQNKESWKSNYIYIDEFIDNIERKKWISNSFKYFRFLIPVKANEVNLIPLININLKCLGIDEKFDLDLNSLLNILNEETPPRFCFSEELYFRNKLLTETESDDTYIEEGIEFRVFLSEIKELEHNEIYRFLTFVRLIDLEKVNS